MKGKEKIDKILREYRNKVTSMKDFFSAEPTIDALTEIEAVMRECMGVPKDSIGKKELTAAEIQLNARAKKFWEKWEGK